MRCSCMTASGEREVIPPPERLKTMQYSRNISHRWWRRLRRTLVITGAMTTFVSCSDTDRSATRFCGTLKSTLPDLTNTVASSDDISALVDRFKTLNDITPLAIQDEWQSLSDLVQLAADTDPLSPESRQALADAAYQAERPTREIERWVEATCGFQMPDVIGLEGPYVP